MKATLFAILFLTCISGYAAYANQASTDLVLQVEGHAAVVKNDEARARDEAVKNALEKAILQASAKILLDKYEDEKFQSVKSVMFGRVDRYIKNYRIVSEVRQHDEYTANVHAVVALLPVREDLLQMGILQDQKEKELISVSLSLAGMKKYSDFDRIRTFLLSRSRTVKNIYPCRLEWQHVSFNLRLDGDVQYLIAEFEKTGRYTIDSVNKDQNAVEINLRVKEESR